MSDYKIVLTASAEKNLLALEFSLAKRISKKIAEFSTDIPPTSRAKKLTDFRNGTFRYRVGDYRIIFDLDETEKRIVILKIAHRKDVYE